MKIKKSKRGKFIRMEIWAIHWDSPLRKKREYDGWIKDPLFSDFAKVEELESNPDRVLDKYLFL